MVCKYCGKSIKEKDGFVCGTCRSKQFLIPKFLRARNRLRRLTGIENRFV